MQTVTVAVRRLAHNQDLPLPAYETAQSAGMDLAAAVTDEIILHPGERALIPTGLQIALPAGYEAQIRPRSGLAVRDGITVLDTPGTIDADYRGEVKVVLVNLGQTPFTVTRGMRVAQLVVAPVARVEWRATDALPATTRGAGGFGSTGLVGKA